MFNMIRDGMTVYEFVQAARNLGGDATDLGFFMVKSAIELQEAIPRMQWAGR